MKMIAVDNGSYAAADVDRLAVSEARNKYTYMTEGTPAARQEEEERDFCDEHIVPSWTDLLAKTKQNTQDDSPWEQIQPHMQQFSMQISHYGHAMHERERNPDSRSPPFTKDMILQTRAALRFATMCLSNEGTRSALQEEAVVTWKWQTPLSYALAQKKGDAKCRILMARLLSNLVTCNQDTATVVASTIPLSPSQEEIDSMLRTTLSSTAINDQLTINARSTWVDMMLACAQSAYRDGLAGIVAALYNCMSSIPCSKSFSGENFSTRVASDRLLMSTLLRQTLPESSVTAAATAAAALDEDTGQDDSLDDSATEWIVRMIEKQCRLGLLPAMCTSAGGGSNDKNTGALVVTPELIVLLHCVARAAHDATGPDNKNEKPFLGGEDGNVATVSSHVFLANEFCSLNRVPSSATIATSSTEREKLTSNDPTLTKEAWFLVVEILASSLGTDVHVSMDEARLAIGRETSVIQNVSLDLGAIVDALSATNQGKSARELIITDDEQRRITGLVQLLGNACFRCRQNQDLVRETIVPFTLLPGTTLCDSCIDRTALHVLLSCTSFAYGCFTLREWAIVALRNVLEGNEANQALVEQLEAQQPVQSAELEGMGLRVDMDPDGKVRVVPTEDEPTDID